MKTIAIAQARMGSTRFPGKVLMDLGGKPMLRWTINALLSVPSIDEVVLATSALTADNPIHKYCFENNISCFRGSEDDVLDRFYQCAKYHSADVILRLTCDCPFLDSRVIEEVIQLREVTNADYASNIDPPSYPDGLDVECFTFSALEAAWNEASRPTDRDCVPQYIVRNRARFPAANLRCPIPGLEKERWVCDTEADYRFCHEIAKRLEDDPSYLNILAILKREPELRNINPGVRNERFYEGLATELLPRRTFTRSHQLLDRAVQTIPFGAQTFSKSHIQFPAGRAPLYVTHADGARIFDVDGNDYVDLVGAVLPVILGYRDQDVDDAVRQQLDRGISFSLATELEVELAELLKKHIPCAEMTKLGKSGTDVTTAAIRLARAYTGRDHVLLSGYHGWADWSMACTDRNLGIPEDVRKLSHRITYGEPKSVIDRELVLRRKGCDIAAIIVEPNDNADFLRWLRQYCDEHGIVLIFDEVITGFRYSMGGAQKLFGVTPDLATFGKAMANGMPISAICGKREIMKLMQPPGNIFYSGTMFGEALSIAASIACINKLETTKALDKIWEAGDVLSRSIQMMADNHGISGHIKIGGQPPRTMLNFSDDKIRTLFMQEMIQGGVLIINSNNLSASHGKPELQRIYTAYDQAFSAIAGCLLRGDIDQRIGNSTVSAAPLRATA